MPDKDIIKSKLAAISEYLPRLMSNLEVYRQGKLMLDDDRVFVIERLFQLIADAAIDINTHIIIQGKLESPDDYEGTFRILGQHKIIPLDFAEKISGSVGLRNRLVHGYEKVQRKIALDDISNGISQYVEYVKHIQEFVENKKIK
ncbi:MAG: DUF86 domain-containing protein [Patescibacteria group bacterium]